MDLTFSPSAEEFRAELRTWLAEHVPVEFRTGDAIEYPTLDEEFAFLRDWQARLARDRWVGVHWPNAYGGRGAGVEANYIFQEEMARARAPEVINRIGVNLVGPSLMHHGTEEQKQRYLPRMFDGSVSASLYVPGGRSVEIGPIGPGEMVGELAMLDGGAQALGCTRAISSMRSWPSAAARTLG
jgi:alkylation response protein AidB-like acyl-CoA dehydrogenase